MAWAASRPLAETLCCATSGPSPAQQPLATSQALVSCHSQCVLFERSSLMMARPRLQCKLCFGMSAAAG